jgi:probable rRNA maturation factor
MRNDLYFHFEDISEFSLPTRIHDWIKGVILNEKFVLSEINVVFSSDRYLITLNKKHLAHDYYTDIVTFDYRTEPQEIRGDLFISKERVIENAAIFNVSINHELLRVVVHGLLHLFGYSDKSEKDKELMRSMEDFYLSLYTKEYVSRGT